MAPRNTKGNTKIRIFENELKILEQRAFSLLSNTSKYNPRNFNHEQVENYITQLFNIVRRQSQLINEMRKHVEPLLKKKFKNDYPWWDRWGRRSVQ